MTLVYRAVWDDYSCDPVGVLDDEFVSWCASKNIDPVDIPRRGNEAVSDQQRIEVRRADAETGRALRCRLEETDNRGRTWTTTATALADHEVSSFWVDLDLHDPERRSLEMAAPRLVRALIDNGGEPTVFGHSLRSQARRVRDTNVDELIDVLVDPERRLPAVVFSPDHRAGPKESLARADAAAETLVGIALTYAFDPSAQAPLDRALPRPFRVYGGAVRLYLPGLQLDDADDSLRHRFLPPRLIAEHPRRAASLLSTRLARQQLHPPIPEAWERMRALLLVPTEGEIGDRAAALASEHKADGDGDTTGLEQRIDELQRQLAEAGLIHEAHEREMRDDVSGLRATVAELEDARWSDADEMEELRRERDGLQRTVRVLQLPPEAATDADDPHLYDTPSSIDEAVTMAQKHLSRVVVPDEALHEIEDLDSSPKYQVWGSAVWQGLLALHDYASVKATGERPAGFRNWCERTAAWPASRVAMVESETVQNNERLRDQRFFPVASEVDERGAIHMFAHLKIQAGGGALIPRIYFHDDTDGSTGKMHVGFIGPHRYVQNTKT